MWKRSDNIVHRLFSRQIIRVAPNTHIHRARELYENILPSHTVYDVECPDHSWRKFTNDGQYLICFSRNFIDLLVYRLSWLSFCSNSDTTDELPAKSKKFESFFSQLYSVPLATGNEIICKDFFISTENNQYGIFATSTTSDSSAPQASGALAGVPSIEKITFLLVRLADGTVVDQRDFHNDYIHLAHNAGVFLHDDLLAILSVRFQCIHILQVREAGFFVDVRTIGTFLREDDELLLNSQSQEEANFHQEQAAVRKARGLLSVGEVVASLMQPSKAWPKPWTSPNARCRRHTRDGRAAPNDPGPSGTTASRSNSSNIVYDDVHGVDFDGYFRGLFGAGNLSANGGSVLQGNGNPREQGTGDHGSHDAGAGLHFDVSTSTSSSLYSTRGSDTRSLSYDTTDPGSSEATTLLDFSSPSTDPGPSERRLHPVPSMSHSGHSMVVPQSRASLLIREESSLPSSSAGVSRLRGNDGYQTASSTAATRVRVPRAGAGGSGMSQSVPGTGGDLGAPVENGREAAGAAFPDDTLQQGGQILGGIKQRLLSFIMRGVQNDDASSVTTSSLKQKAQRLNRFYYHFQQYVDLVMWKVQFLDRHHLLIKFGSVDGVVVRNSESSHQTAFLVVYNVETTQMLGFYQNSSEELAQWVEHYCDHFRVVPRYPTYMSFISSCGNNSFAREQLRRQKAAFISGKAGSYIQVVKRTLAFLPCNAQSQSPSPYFDQYLFHYDEKLISATDRHKPCMEHPIKFISRRRPNTLKFKINPGKYPDHGYFSVSIL